jgi:hypothetical protein
VCVVHRAIRMTRKHVKKRFVLRCNAPNMRVCMNTSCDRFACVTRAYTRYSTRVDVQTLHMRKHNRRLSNVLFVDKRLLHYACMHVMTYIRMCMCIRVCVHVCMCACVYVHTYVCVHVMCMCVCACVYVYVCHMHHALCMCVCARVCI